MLLLASRGTAVTDSTVGRVFRPRAASAAEDISRAISRDSCLDVSLASVYAFPHRSMSPGLATPPGDDPLPLSPPLP